MSFNVSPPAGTLPAQPPSEPPADRIDIPAAGGAVKHIHLKQHPDGVIEATGAVADFTVTRFYWHLYNRYTSRLPGMRSIHQIDDGQTWRAVIAPAPSPALDVETDRFRRQFARWRAQFPYLKDKERTIQRIVDRYGDTPAALRMYRRLNAWLGGKFTFDRPRVAETTK